MRNFPSKHLRGGMNGEQNGVIQTDRYCKILQTERKRGWESASYGQRRWGLTLLSLILYIFFGDEGRNFKDMECD